MTSWVMFGHSPLFGDLVDIIRANGGQLRKVVQNIPEQVRAGTKPLAALIEEQRRVGGGEQIQVQALADFTPEQGERYLIGFRSHRLIPLRAELRRRWALEFPALIHPRAMVSPTAHIGEGSFVGAGAIVAAGCNIGRYALLNRGCTIGHDCVLEDFVNVGPGANLASFVTLRANSTISLGANLVNWVEVGAHSVVAAGAVVLENVPERTLVAGIPARVKKLLELPDAPAAIEERADITR